MPGASQGGEGAIFIFSLSLGIGASNIKYNIFIFIKGIFFFLIYISLKTSIETNRSSNLSKFFLKSKLMFSEFGLEAWTTLIPEKLLVMTLWFKSTLMDHSSWSVNSNMTNKEISYFYIYLVKIKSKIA